MANTITDLVTEVAYRRMALEDPNSLLELYRGTLREKPVMSAWHGAVMFRLVGLLLSQLDQEEFRLRANHARVRKSSDTYYVPDIIVIPAAVESALLREPDALDAYPEPLPLVVEIWSPSTGSYDIDEKLPGYQARGDEEIWRVHPLERTVRVWRRRPDGTYDETFYRDGTIRLGSLPGVSIDLEALFDL